MSFPFIKVYCLLVKYKVLECQHLVRFSYCVSSKEIIFIFVYMMFVSVQYVDSMWGWVPRYHGTHLEVKRQPWVLVPHFSPWDGISFSLSMPGWLTYSFQGSSYSPNSAQQLWNYRFQPSLPDVNGLRLFKLRPSYFHGKSFTHWATSPVRYSHTICACHIVYHKLFLCALIDSMQTFMGRNWYSSNSYDWQKYGNRQVIWLALGELETFLHHKQK